MNTIITLSALQETIQADEWSYRYNFIIKDKRGSNIFYCVEIENSLQSWFVDYTYNNSLIYLDIFKIQLLTQKISSYIINRIVVVLTDSNSSTILYNEMENDSISSKNYSSKIVLA
ncbi:hypothetical protein GBBBJNDB_00266 [Pseudomonas phage Callisto]|nr:hypothetical protein GBBBJNDB_00266 [Pseudomonas phage Callisto]